LIRVEGTWKKGEDGVFGGAYFVGFEETCVGIVGLIAVEVELVRIWVFGLLGEAGAVDYVFDCVPH
jgi:hypothetical protein